MMRLAMKVLITGLAGAFGACWMLIPHRFEGPVLFTVSVTHGVHRNDWVGVFVPVAVALVVWFPEVQREMRARPPRRQRR